MKKFFKSIWNGWMKFAHIWGRFNTMLLLSLFFFLIVSPIGLLFRIFGWDPLEVKTQKSKRGTNWKTVAEPGTMKRQS